MDIIQPTPTSVSTTYPALEKSLFVKYANDTGRQYRNRAMKLISISRNFTQAQEQTRTSYDELRSVLHVVDDALYSATEAQKKTTKDADAKYKKAIGALSAYEMKYHPMETVTHTMAEAEAKDKSSWTIFKWLEETVPEEQMVPVEFLIYRSLLDENPTIVIQFLSESSDISEVLWNFSRFKGERRLTLKDNPHFYEELPRSPEEYGDNFLMEPIETFMHKRISVLTDKLGQAGQVFLKTAKKTRAFGNVCVPRNAIIFKDVQGKLEGESIVGADIQDTPNLWCFAESSPSHTPPSSPSSNRGGQSPTTTATPTTSSSGLLLTDWRDSICQMLHSPDVNIHISTEPPINSIPISTSPQLLPQFHSRASVAVSVTFRPSLNDLRQSYRKDHPHVRPQNHPSNYPVSLRPYKPSVSELLPFPSQLPSLASPSTDLATPARILARPHPDTHSRRVSKKDGTFLGPTIPSQLRSAGVRNRKDTATRTALMV